MKNFILFAATLVSLAGCGDNNKATDAAPSRDAPVDSPTTIPTPPTLGAEIDRMGRPGINTALNHAFDGSATTAGAAKDAYNQDKAGPASWGSNATYLGAFAQSLAILDSLDQGIGNTTVTPGKSCGNQVLYDGSGSGTASACLSGSSYLGTCSYNAAAGFSADDELYVESSKGTCNLYLAVELYTAVLNTGGVAPSCGGRAPSYDVIDVTYSALAGFPNAFNSVTLAPQIGDGVGVHADTSDTTFPFLGAPH